MLDPVGTKEKHGFEHATTEAYDMFQPHLKMNMVAVHVNGDEMAWVIENHFTMNGETLKTHSIETFAWDAAGDLLIKTYYDMPADVGLRRFGGLVRSPNAPLKVPLTIQWHHVVFDRLDQPETLQLMEFVEVVLGQIAGLDPFGTAVVDFP
jgi:hypothetical protein